MGFEIETKGCLFLGKRFGGFWRIRVWDAIRDRDDDEQEAIVVVVGLGIVFLVVPNPFVNYLLNVFL